MYNKIENIKNGNSVTNHTDKNNTSLSIMVLLCGPLYNIGEYTLINIFNIILRILPNVF